MIGRKHLLILSIAVGASMAAVAIYSTSIAARNRDITDRFVKALDNSDEIKLNWFRATQHIKEADRISELKRDITTQPLQWEWNYKKRLVHASISLLCDGQELSVIEYWGDGLISIEGQLFRIGRDPFLRLQEEVKNEEAKNGGAKKGASLIYVYEVRTRVTTLMDSTQRRYAPTRSTNRNL